MQRLDPTPDTVTDVFDRDRKPVLTIDPGERLSVQTLNCSGHLQRQRTPGEERPKLIDPSRGHCLAGPIHINGAEPGTVLAVHLESLRPDEWGFTVAGSRDTPLNRALGLATGAPSHLLWDLDAEAGTGTNDRGQTVTLAPFLGVIGLPPDEPGEHPTGPPRPVGGGNIDCRELVAGTTLYLPVTVSGGLLCLGDGHAAQGDGEVSGTAIECGMTTELVFEILPERPVSGIHAETPAGRITFGFSADLNEAMTASLGAMLDWMMDLFSLDRAAALALASPTVDLRITQVANGTWGVHAVLPPDVIR
jgi:acetamidase/formamidase